MGHMDGEEKIKKAYEAILSHDFEQAIEWFERAIADDPNNASYHYKLSITYARSNKLGKALEHAQTACRLDLRHEEYKYHLQNLQAKELIQKAQTVLNMPSKQLHLAISLLKQAVRLDSLALEAYLLLSVAYAELEEYSKAIESMREVLKLDPQHEYAQTLLTEYQTQLKNYLRLNKRKD
jgi:tetratricopeptide (TPR) repeat protein